jgi:uncharacterized membrane protein
MKKCFFTGLAILLPIVLTILIVLFILNVLTRPFLPVVFNTLDYLDLFQTSIGVFSGSQVRVLAAKAIVLFSFIFVTLLIGFLSQAYLIKVFGKLANFFLHRTPVINTIYKSLQDIVQTLFVKKTEQPNFSKVVLVPFPYAKTYSIGFITHSDEGDQRSEVEYRELMSVFVPGTPNPMMGFMLLFRRDQVISLDIGVEEAIKFLVSVGVIAPNFSIEQALNINE